MRRSSINFSGYILLALFICAPALTGCTTLVSPYSTAFQCPDSDKGKCVSVKTAYDESIEENPLVKESTCDECDGKEEKKDGGKSKNASVRRDVNILKYNYQDSLYKKMTSILEQPETPLVIPPDVMRVLIPSYTGADNELFSARYVYFFVTEPRWSISAATEERE
jgi:conjugal transfer pilus assembly protein TraV